MKYFMPVKICSCGVIYDAIPEFAIVMNEGDQMDGSYWECTECKSTLLVLACPIEKRETPVLKLKEDCLVVHNCRECGSTWDDQALHVACISCGSQNLFLETMTFNDFDDLRRSI